MLGRKPGIGTASEAAILRTHPDLRVPAPAGAVPLRDLMP